METGLVKVGDLPLTTLGELESAGKLLAQSGMFGVQNAAAGFVIAATCKQQGISLLEFRRTYHIVDGNPSMRSDAMLAEFRKRGGKCRILANDTKEAKAEFEFEGLKKVFAFTIEDAKRIGDCYKGDGKTMKYNWTKRPEDMLWARLVSRTLRRLCPEIVAGLYTPEEISDFDEPKATANATPKSKVMPKAKPEPKTIDVEPEQEPGPDYTVCPIDYDDYLNKPWTEFEREQLEKALESDLPNEYKAEIQKVLDMDAEA